MSILSMVKLPPSSRTASSTLGKMRESTRCPISSTSSDGISTHPSRQALGELYLWGMVDSPRRAVSDDVNERTGRGQAGAAALDAPEGQVHLSADGGQVDIADAEL